MKRAALGAAGATGLLAACKRAANDTKDGSLSQTELPIGEMTYRQFDGGDRVSLLGFGCMRFPMVEGSKTPAVDQRFVDALVDTAMKHGVNYYDTAPVYCEGLSERAIGSSLKRYPRKNYYIATKLSNFDKSQWSREASIALYRNSFKELQTDYIDYYLLHAVGVGDDGFRQFMTRFVDNGMIDFLVGERRAGRIRKLGFSYHGDVRSFDWLLAHHDQYHWDFVQIQLNYVDWHYAKTNSERETNAEYLYGELRKRGIPAVIMEPLLGGRLVKMPHAIATSLKQKAPERSVASWAFRYAGSYDGVLTVLSGMERMEHLEDNLRSYCPLVKLTKEEVSFLHANAKLIVDFPTVGCTGCKYCMPCPYGINIPAVFAHYDECVNEGTVPDDRKDPHYAAARRAYLIGYDRSVPRLRQADHCIGCGRCRELCPQNIDIPRQMQRISDLVESLRDTRDDS